jgi:hypothetical protein
VFETLKSGSVLQVGVPYGERIFGRAVKGRSSAYGWCRAHIDDESSDVHFSCIDEAVNRLPIILGKRLASREGNNMVIADLSGRTGLLWQRLMTLAGVNFRFA